MIILAVLFISAFTRLGFWQLQRADEKAKMVANEESLAKQEPIEWSSKSKLPRQYQRIKLKGTYLQELFLLDNQHYNHELGYDAISPLLIEDGSVVMVDRGWIAADNNRNSFPEVKTIKEKIQLQGSVYYPPKNQWVLGPNLEKKDNGVVIIELLDTNLLEQILQKKVYPFIIRLNKKDAHGFVREWAIVSMPPQRHLAYALQWFAMAFVILILFVVLNLKKKNEENKF